MAISSAKLSRKQLYKKVWEVPIHRLSLKYGLSDVGLAKVCKRMDIPRPPRGYWRQRETGAKVKKAPLPKAKQGTQMEVEFVNRGKAPKKRVVKKEVRIPKSPPNLEDGLSDPHPLVATTRDRLESAKEDECAILIPRAKSILEVRVSREEVDRCLRLMDALIKSWEAEGLSVKLLRVHEDDDVGAFLCLGDEHLRISIEEGVEEFDPEPTDEEKLHPKWEWIERTASRSTKEVTLRLDGDYVGPRNRFHRRCKDRPGVPIETRALQIWSAGMEYLEKRKQHAIEEEKRRAAEEEAQRLRKLEWERKQAEWQREREEERRREEEKRRVEELAEAAQAWSRAQQVRAFIPVCEKRLAESGACADAIVEWTAWALNAADQIDPLTQGYPELPGSETSR